MAFEFYITPEEYEIAKQNGISPKLVDSRVRNHGWDKRKAITVPARKFRSTSDWVKIAEQNGISYKTFWKRIKDGWDEKKAAIEPIMDMTQIGELNRELNRIYPHEYIEKAKQNGIIRQTLSYRMNHGWNIEEACARKPMTTSEVGKLAKERSRWRGDGRTPKVANCS